MKYHNISRDREERTPSCVNERENTFFKLEKTLSRVLISRTIKIKKSVSIERPCGLLSMLVTDV